MPSHFILLLKEGYQLHMINHNSMRAQSVKDRANSKYRGKDSKERNLCSEIKDVLLINMITYQSTNVFI